MERIEIAWDTVHAAPASHCLHESPYGFDETVERLAEAIRSEGLWLIHKIEAHKLLAKGGYAIGHLSQLLFFHPDYMARILQTDINAPIEAPLKFVVMDMADGSVTVRYKDPAGTFKSYKGLLDLGDTLSEKCRDAIAVALAALPE